MKDFLSVPWKRALLLLGVLLVTTAVYAIHFDNDFHFDDSHAIQSNPHIQSISNWKRFFVDSSTFSSSLSHQGYRPLLAFEFAVDHWLAGGLKTPWFHVHSYLLYMLLLVCMYFMYRILLIRAFESEYKGTVLAFIGTTVFALHPVSAETVNYIVQRGDLWDALGVTASMWLYLRSEKAIGWHLLPMFVACFAKQAAVMYGPILGAYVFFETAGSVPQKIVGMLKKIWPAFVVIGIFFAIYRHFEAATAELGGNNPWYYWRSQPFMLWYEIKCFFLPTTLTADTDMPGVEWFDFRFFVGVFTVLGMAVGMFPLGKRKKFRPAALGFAWFLLANLPTSALPLAEITNDHRMFLPFVGLTLSVTNFAGVWYEGFATKKRKWAPTAVTAALMLIFAAEAFGTVQRNMVWDTEETLWRDVTIKSPNNGRGLMNYGLTLMGKGQLKEALVIYERAHKLIPNYAYLETNLAIVKGAIGGMDDQAEKHFKRAVQLIREPVAHPYWTRYLVQRGRYDEARNVLKDGLARMPDNWPMRIAYLDIAERIGVWGELKRAYEETRKYYPDRQELNRFAQSLARAELRRRELEASAANLPLAQRCELAELRYGFGEPDAALQAAMQALQLDANAWCGHRIAAFSLSELRRFTDAAYHAELALGLPGGDQGQRLALEALRRDARAVPASHP